MANNDLKIGGLYRHFKGGLYILRGIAEHSENGKSYVIYEDAATGKLWVRPYGAFVSRVDVKKYPEATQGYRFELIPGDPEPEEDEVCEACAITYSWERGSANVLGETNDEDQQNYGTEGGATS